MSSPYVSIIIPNFNGAHLLEKNLPILLKEANRLGQFEIIVVDDGSSDKSIGILKQRFPEVKVVSLDKNLGFGIAVNTGASLSNGEVILVINNDVWLKEGFFNPIIRHFGDDSLFSVVPTILSNNRGNEAIVGARFWYGLFGINRLGVKYDSKNKIEILYPSGAVAAYDKKKFLELGGFDDIYVPFYWEDVDLGYRAWKMGWRTIYEPESIAYHEHRATIKQFYTDHFIQVIEQRNAIIFVWKNIDDLYLLFEHILFLPIRLLRAIFIQDKVFLKAFWQALRMIKNVLTRRRIRKQANLTDKEIITRIKGNLI